ncbi:unnamed protein product [Parajaminaea phylloscopi]
MSQQQLKVDADDKGSGHVTTTSSKRKQDDVEDTKEGSRQGGDEESSPPPAKAARAEDEASSEERQSKDDAQEPPARDAQEAPASPRAQGELTGKDTGPVGHDQEEVEWEILERGHIYWFYRPKVQPAGDEKSDEPAAKSIDGTQNAHMLLLPKDSQSDTAPAKPEDQVPKDIDSKSEQTGEKARRGGIGARLIRLGKKRMPEPTVAIENGDQPGGIGGDSSETIWSVISDVAHSLEALKDSFAARHYSTRTAGDRVVQGARTAARGWYVLSLSHQEPPSARQVRLSYALSHPHDEGDFGPVQKELGLRKESSVALQMRNPTLASTGPGAPPAGLDPSSRVELDKSELNETFGGDADKGTRYARPENIELLDRAGVELLLIKKKEQEAEGDLGLGETHRAALEKLAAADAKALSNMDVLASIRLDSQENPPDALEGDWI